MGILGKKLVIVESPSKSKTIEKYLGSDYKVVSSLGHIRDLSTSGKFGFGVDLDNKFKPDYKIIKGKTNLTKKLQKKKIGGEFTDVLFRDKYYGYHYSSFSIYACK